ncbi:polyketide cyclase/dehydrase/lipid transport protein [Microterricola gilva]|uniref:Polyketide cyclase/dehydrase/lipid transport protein n=1 Tax=Microterricola gilva TaxID=393267 RepID=A0A4Q8AS15_9MICO|nr:SRPBCC family protein [Microterricola gilva]RZU67061.1 polyketide cyclase/dehydrase/lipid transport protein [Microterricola gilva]
MVRITNTIDIDASAMRVYSTLRALDAYSSWLGHSTVYRGTEERTPQAEGSLSYEDTTMVGRMRGEIVEDVPEHVLQFHQSKPNGSLDAVIRYELEATGAGTHLTRFGDLTTHGILRIVQPILLRMAAAESERTMTALKRHLERGA